MSSRIRWSPAHLEYDGAPFAGWAVQPGERTVCGELEAALATVLRAPVVADRRRAHRPRRARARPGRAPTRASCRRCARSTRVLPRRDRGARAPRRCPTASPPATTRARAPTSTACCARGSAVAVRARPRAVVAASARRGGAARLRRRCCAGTHDFTAFTPTETYHQRFERDVLDARWARAGDVLEFHIEADTFMRHMNRVLVGTMLEVAGGRRSARDFAALLEGAPARRGGADGAAARALPAGGDLRSARSATGPS